MFRVVSAAAVAAFAAAALFAIPAFAGSSAYFTGKGENENGPAINRAGAHLSKGVVDEVFVRYRTLCSVDGADPKLRRGSMLHYTRDLNISDEGRFKRVYDQKWHKHTAVRIVLRGRIDGNSIEGSLRSRSRNNSQGSVEKCNSGRMRYELDPSSKKAFYDGFEVG